MRRASSPCRTANFFVVLVHFALSNSPKLKKPSAVGLVFGNPLDAARLNRGGPFSREARGLGPRLELPLPAATCGRHARSTATIGCGSDLRNAATNTHQRTSLRLLAVNVHRLEGRGVPCHLHRVAVQNRNQRHQRGVIDHFGAEESAPAAVELDAVRLKRHAGGEPEIDEQVVADYRGRRKVGRQSSLPSSLPDAFVHPFSRRPKRRCRAPLLRCHACLASFLRCHDSSSWRIVPKQEEPFHFAIAVARERYMPTITLTTLIHAPRER